jgi:DNA polymerase I-like protein with 3'-5' exonuclease and polymerase domains
MGLYGLPLGDKDLPSNHARRLKKLVSVHGEAMFLADNRTLGAWDHLLRWLQRQHLVMHHKKYDCHMFSAGLRNATNTAHDLMNIVLSDTKLVQDVLDPQHSSSLKPTSVRLHLGKELGIEEGAEAAEAEALAPWKGPKEDPRYDLIPWEVLEPYSKTDAVLTLLLHENQVSRLSYMEGPDGDLARRLIARQEALSRTLYYMEERGVGADKTFWLGQDRVLTKLVAESRAQLPFRPTPDGARKWFFGPPAEGGLGLLPFSDKLTPGGKGQVDEDVIARLIKLGADGAAEYQTFAGLKSASEKWFAAWARLVGDDGRIRTNYRQGHVVTGRLSVERWQAQAMPHDYQIPEGIEPPRKGIIARDGHTLWEADVKQAEIRVATRLAKCGPMMRAIKNGIDSHDAACKLMLYPALKLAEAKQDPNWSRYRDIAKRCNLGILYGGGVGAIHDTILKFTGIDYDRDQVAEWIRDWRRAFPPFVRALDNYADLASKQGWVRLIDGSVRYFSEWEPVHKAFNAVIQGSVAVAVEAAMIEFDRQYPGVLLLQIHDSMVAEIPNDRTGEICAAMDLSLRRNFDRLFRPVPFAVDIKKFGRDAYQEVA